MTNHNSPMTDTARGRCTLVGAGPGDPELLTLKAIKAIAKADLLLIDDLVSQAIIDMAPPSARVIHVGKRGGCKSTPQDFIQKLIISAVQDRQNVVRLKGGDPFIFGRGGEEVEALKAEGIMVEVINGITAGLAAISSLNVSLTHRDHAHGVIFITGHNQKGIQVIDWKELAQTAHRARLTLIIYMGVSSVYKLQSELLFGLPAHTPVAIIENASLPNQRHAISKLEKLSATIERENLRSPSIIVVGDVLTGLKEIGLPAILAA